MTWMLATVTGAEEAEIAVAAGVDIVDFMTSEPEALRDAVRAVAGRALVSAQTGELPADGEAAVTAVRAVAAAGVDFVRTGVGRGLVLNEVLPALAEIARRVRLIAVLYADRGQDFAALEALAAAGFAGAMLAVADPVKPRLLEHADPGQLVRFASLCRRSRLMAGFAGALEAPDVPRLLRLDPDIVGFRRALCLGHDRKATLQPDAVARIRRLIPQHGEAGRAGPDPGKPEAAGLDRVFVRDLVLEVSIGAYRRERDRPQRVRFEVTADVYRQPPKGDDIGEVFSYDVILDTIAGLVQDRHVALVETLAEEIAAKLLEHGRVASVAVKVEKLDVAPAVVGVEIVRTRP